MKNSNSFCIFNLREVDQQVIIDKKEDENESPGRLLQTMVKILLC